MKILDVVISSFFKLLKLHFCFSPKKVKTWKMHLFTILQTLGLVILWIVKSSALALAFPFFVLGMVPYRMAFKFIFTSMELEAVSIFYVFLSRIFIYLKAITISIFDVLSTGFFCIVNRVNAFDF